MGLFKKSNTSKDKIEDEMINNDAYGAFLVSKNVYSGRPIRYTYREKSTIYVANGWTIYSCDDDDSYVSDPKNFVFLNAQSINQISPIMLLLYDAPYGTDLCWMYDKKGNFTGFYDLKEDKFTTMKEILNK